MSKMQLRFKDPDLYASAFGLPAEEEAARNWYREYSEHGDYWCLELDMETKTWRLLPKREWTV